MNYNIINMIESIYNYYNIQELPTFHNRYKLIDEIFNIYISKYNITYNESLKYIVYDILQFLQPIDIINGFTEHYRYFSLEIFKFQDLNELILKYINGDLIDLKNIIDLFFFNIDKYILKEYLEFYK